MPAILNRDCYLPSSEILQLIFNGVTSLVYGTSDNLNYAGHITSVYFLDCNDTEIAHLTMLSDSPVYYSRKWGESVKLQYHRGIDFERTISNPELNITPDSILPIIRN